MSEDPFEPTTTSDNLTASPVARETVEDLREIATLQRLEIIAERIEAAVSTSESRKPAHSKDDPALRDGPTTSESKIALIATFVLGPIFFGLSTIIPDTSPELRQAFVTLGMILTGGAPPAYVLSRGIAKSGFRAGPAAGAALVCVCVLVAFPGCRGPAKDSDYLRPRCGR